MAETTSKSLLNLETVTEHPTVSINKKRYELIPPTSLTVVDYHSLGTLGPRLWELWKRKDISNEEAEELQTILRRIVKIILGAPDEVLESLTDLQRLAIYQTFQLLPSNVLLPMTGQQAKATEKAIRSIGETSRRDSRDSTEEARAGGSRKNRSGR